MPWYSFEPYPNSEVLKNELMRAGFKINSDGIVTGNGDLYLIPTPEFLDYFKKNLSLGESYDRFYPGKQVTAMRFEKYIPDSKEGVPFLAYLEPTELRIVVPDIQTLEGEILALNIDPSIISSVFLDGQPIEPQEILSKGNYIGVFLRTIVEKEMDFGLNAKTFSRSLKIIDSRGEVKINILIAPAHWNVSLGNSWEGSKPFNEKVSEKATRIAEDGATGMEFAITYFVKDEYSNVIYKGMWSADETTIRNIAENAKRNGLRSGLALHVVVDEEKWQWAGLLHPNDMNELKRTYADDYVIPVALLAEKYGIDSISIFNELDWAVSDERYALDLIRRVRSEYSGEIGIKLASWKGNQPGGFLKAMDYGSIFNILSIAVIEEIDWLGLNLYVPGPTRESCSDKETLMTYMIPQLNYISGEFRARGVDINKLRQ